MRSYDNTLLMILRCMFLHFNAVLCCTVCTLMYILELLFLVVILIMLFASIVNHRAQAKGTLMLTLPQQYSCFSLASSLIPQSVFFPLQCSDVGALSHSRLCL